MRLPGRSTPRLIVAPAAVAAFAIFELWSMGALTALGAGWIVFVLCVFALAAWGKLHLARTEHRLRSLREQRSSRPR